MRRLALGQLLKRFEITAHQRFFLGAAPFLELALVLDRVGNSIKPLRENQLYGSSS